MSQTGRPRKYNTDEERRLVRRAEYKRDRIKRIASVVASKKKRLEREPDLEHKLYLRNLELHENFNKKRQVREFGLTFDEYNKKVILQNNLCKICGRAETAKRNGIILALSIDHDHRFTKKHIRDLLCQQCNSALGGFKESIETMENAIEYLKYWHEVYRDSNNMQ